MSQPAHALERKGQVGGRLVQRDAELGLQPEHEHRCTLDVAGGAFARLKLVTPAGSMATSKSITHQCPRLWTPIRLPRRNEAVSESAQRNRQVDALDQCAGSLEHIKRAKCSPRAVIRQGDKVQLVPIDPGQVGRL